MSEKTRHSRFREDGHHRRQRVLDEAQRLIGERGYHGFGIQELASRCDLTKPGLLHHFGSKDQLLIALLRDRDVRHEEALFPLLGEDFERAEEAEDKRTLFIRGFRTLFERNVAQPELMRLHTILRVEAINPSHPAHVYFQAREAAKLELIAARLAAFVPFPQSVARQLSALMTGLEEQWLRSGCQFDLVAEFDRGIIKLLPPAHPAVASHGN